jgi:hypothetical protein
VKLSNHQFRRLWSLRHCVDGTHKEDCCCSLVVALAKRMLQRVLIECDRTKLQYRGGPGLQCLLQRHKNHEQLFHRGLSTGSQRPALPRRRHHDPSSPRAPTSSLRSVRVQRCCVSDRSPLFSQHHAPAPSSGDILPRLGFSLPSGTRACLPCPQHRATSRSRTVGWRSWWDPRPLGE